VATTRRNFLKSAAGALALLGVGCGSSGGGSRGPSSTGDPGNPGGGPTTPPTTPPANPPPDNPPPAMLTGRIVRPGDADYDLARANYNPQNMVERVETHGGTKHLLIQAADRSPIASSSSGGSWQKMAMSGRFNEPSGKLTYTSAMCTQSHWVWCGSGALL